MIYIDEDYEDDRRIIGECDSCGYRLDTNEEHWLVLYPWRKRVRLVCRDCRKSLMMTLGNEDNRDSDGRFTFFWDGQHHTIDETDREVLEAQLDDDEAILPDE